MSKTVWLKWDGIYSASGVCNQPLLPLDAGENQIKAIKQRLTLLGFKCNEINNDLDNDTKIALLTFNSYCDHPDIHLKVNPCGNCGKTLHKPFEPCRRHGNQTAPVQDFYDDSTIRMLESLDDEWWQPQAQNELIQETEVIGVDLSRSRIGRANSFDFTLHSATSIAVKVVSTPDEFSRFSEYAAIQLQIEGFETVKKLLFQIYKEFDGDPDTIEVDAKKLVYQEILDLDGISKLPSEGPPDGNKGAHRDAKAFITKQMIGGGMTGFFGNYIDSAFERIHAPYKVVVWISNDENEFEESDEPETQNEGTGEADHRPGTVGIHDVEAQESFRKIRTSLIKGEGTSNPLFGLAPELTELVTVHDRSNIRNGEEGEEGLRTSWSDFTDKNPLLLQPQYWTEENADRINLIGQQCEHHDNEFLKRNEIQPEEFPNKFRDDSLETYRNLRERLEHEGENFKYPELSEVFHNVGRHVNIIKRRLCCGQWNQIDEELKENIVSFLDEQIDPKIGELLANQCPNDDSMIFFNSFMFFFSFVVHKAVVRPELDFFETFGLQENQAPNDSNEYNEYLRNRRNKIDGNLSDAQCEYGFYNKHPFDGSNNSAEFFTADGFNSQGYPYMKNKIASNTSMTPVTNLVNALFEPGNRIGRDKRKRKFEAKYANLAKVILVPSYNPLDVFFFVEIRAVPMFMVGMFDLQYLTADGIRQIPIGFYEHDLFHVNTGQGTQQHPTLLKRLCSTIQDSAGSENPMTEFDVYERWQRNLANVIRHIGQRRGDQHFTLGFLYFFILHEPMGLSGYEFVKALNILIQSPVPGRAPRQADSINAYLRNNNVQADRVQSLTEVFKSPALPEPGSMLDRVEEGVLVEVVREKIKNDFFGSYSYIALDHLELIMEEIFLEWDSLRAIEDQL